MSCGLGNHSVLVKFSKIDVFDFPSVAAYKYREGVATRTLRPFWTSENNPKNGFHKPGLENPTERVAGTQSKQRMAPLSGEFKALLTATVNTEAQNTGAAIDNDSTDKIEEAMGQPEGSKE
ncbi:hypothetical protein B0H16DRAFT_1459940 [Mycena metata]|uniref:Uncharacterized protein n=1 Tax=Mycena metata TaxID=1033252 RepID=A0AAD7IX34_9AGAR|nr:hypothetical protein B0H16DRAFT_1459940 [Mycena metata]